MENLVFVYGTLKKGYSNHHLLKNGKFLGEAKTKYKYALYEKVYPYVSHNPKVSNIHGEVYQVDNFTLRKLDILEGHPYEYKRELIPVILNNKELKAWMYFNDKYKGGKLIPQGIYKKQTPRKRG